MANANANVAQLQQSQSQQNGSSSSLVFVFGSSADGTANGAALPPQLVQHHQLQHQHHSVIVHTQQQQMAREEAEEDNAEKQRRRRGRKRKRMEREQQQDEEEEENNEAEEEEQQQGQRSEEEEGGTTTTRTAPSPRAIGVRRFISPFEERVKIPLPHELEQSTHGTTVWRRNERERQRVQQLNGGFTQLRGFLPLIDRDRRMSKVDSLRLAIAYIRHLELLLVQSHAHLAECNCFKQSYGGGDGRSSGAESTPPPT